MQERPPRVSVILLVGNRRERSARALRSVLNQKGLEEAEVLLIDAGAAGISPLEGSDHPKVRIIRPESNGTFGSLRAMGVRAARGEMIAFIEDHVLAKAGWLRGLIAAFDGPWAAVGAEVHNANSAVGISSAIALMNYGPWIPPLERGEAEMLAGNNTAYRRPVLLQYDSQLDELLLSDTVLQWRLVADGHRLFAEPDMAIEHLNPTTIRTCSKAEFFYHWCFAAARANTFGWTRGAKARYVLLSPLIPWLRFARLFALLRRKRPHGSSVSFTGWLAIMLLLHAAVLGQAMGLVFGLSDADRRFTQFELHGPRPVQ
jgi:glycosyltransferase involved in cell wall biosynthesis